MHEPDEALALASREDWSDILIIGYQNDQFAYRSSTMTRKDALWLVKQAELDVLDFWDTPAKPLNDAQIGAYAQGW